MVENVGYKAVDLRAAYESLLQVGEGAQFVVPCNTLFVNNAFGYFLLLFDCERTFTTQKPLSITTMASFSQNETPV